MHGIITCSACGVCGQQCIARDADNYPDDQLSACCGGSQQYIAVMLITILMNIFLPAATCAGPWGTDSSAG
jgi:hypothetical protein